MDFKEIRKISIDSIASNNEGFGVLSNLNWIRYERQVSEISKFLSDNFKVLDIGCGRGMTGVMIKQINPTSDVTGVDLNKFTSWDNYYKKYNVKYFVGDALDLKFNDNEFDLIFSFGVIEHVDSDQKFIRENLRILKDGGIGFMFNIPNKYSSNEFTARKLGIWSHDIRYTRQQIKNLLTSNGIKEFTIKRRFLVPAQTSRVNNLIGKAFDKFHIQLDILDRVLCKTPLNFFSQVFDVVYRKEK
ncbi:MAG: class I SAM-dependent methyltransferase [Candidatus Aenigmarchaeota archaeon]|nr:class I SAM-dependent methyltransferase [Candidatus Aenigmarchaeota archaeon]